jgi:flagellar biosynthesis protein FlgN
VSAAQGSGTIANLLSQEVQTLRSFIALLSDEQRLLVSGSAEGLTALAEEKTRTATTLGRLAASRDQELAHLHFPAGRAGMDAWILTNEGSPRKGDWDQLLHLAAKSRSLNDENGKLITLHLRHNQQALSVLMAAADQTSTYGPDGHPRQGTPGRSLGSA